MDVAVIETGNGGDLQIAGNDLAMVFNGENNPYLAMFGGNPGFPSRNKVEEEQSFDWWANNFLMPNDQSKQFNSLTEYTLNTVSLNSTGRIKIEEAMKKDLAFMSGVAIISVEVFIISDDHVQAKIKILQDVNQKIKVVNFRKTRDGDFSIIDFSDEDFLT